MVQKQIIWTIRAIDDKFDILKYWANRNKSVTYSEKLDALFDNAVEQVSKFPDHGKKTNFKDIRIKIVRSYLIYYLVEEDSITVVRIWSGEQDPKKFELR